MRSFALFTTINDEREFIDRSTITRVRETLDETGKGHECIVFTADGSFTVAMPLDRFAADYLDTTIPKGKRPDRAPDPLLHIGDFFDIGLLDNAVGQIMSIIQAQNAWLAGAEDRASAITADHTHTMVMHLRQFRASVTRMQNALATLAADAAAEEAAMDAALDRGRRATTDPVTGEAVDLLTGKPAEAAPTEA